MSEKNQQSLSSLMKKQIKEDNKKNQAKKISSDAKIKSNDNKNEKELDEAATEEMTEEEKLEDAKKASNNKAAQYDRSGMIKKLILESIIKYTALLAVLVMFAFGIIKLGPAIVDMFSGLLSKILFGAITTK